MACCFLTAHAFAAERGPSSSQTAAAVDRQLEQELSLPAGPSAAPQASDEIFLRRVTLDLTGQLPTPGKITAFALDPAADKRAQLVEELLASDAFGENWGRYWRDVVMFRRSDERGLLASGPLERRLAEALNENTPWDAVATELITAKGDVREDGRTGLIMAHVGRPEETVAEISRIFMGVQIQCAQCHDHPTDRWKREQFHELAAFFPRVAVRPNQANGPRSFAVVADDFPAFRRDVNAANRFRGTPEHYMPDLEHPEAEGTRMTPVFFVTGQRLPLGTKDVDRRAALAKWLTSPENPWFAKAAVNRIWSELVGNGFYEPVDDMGPDRDCNAPQTLDLLAAGFVASGHDMKWLYRTIMATDAYQRESRPRGGSQEKSFAANCPQPLRADQLYDALVHALGIPAQPAARGGNPYNDGPLAAGPRGQFGQLFGYDPSDARDEIEGSIPQSLALMNSPQLSALISASPFTPLGKLLRELDNDEDVVVDLYLRGLARQPRDAEIAKCLQYVKSVGNRDEAFEDILWAIVNSAEFLHRR
ncbi:MAG: DUF1549 domain-containing protein [Planctomycetales bacterium]|nr:DUF1549 domain-containing protein [Planctomycetales bacterium]